MKVKENIINLNRYKCLLSELVTKDLKVRYRKSILGVFWTLLSPLLMMVVLSLVFSSIFRFQIEHYPVYILSGQLVFNFFSEATNTMMGSVVGNAPLIKKIYVPKYMFPISAMLSSIINVLASFAALIIVMVFMRVPLHYTMLLSFIPVVVLAIFATGVGMILSAVVVKFRDIMHFYSVFLTALMYLMPVIYPMSTLDAMPVIQTIVAYNPLTMILNMFRDLVMNGTMLDPVTLLITFVVALAFLGIGFWVFYRKQDTFIMDI